MEMLLTTPAMQGIGALLLAAWIRYHACDTDETGEPIARTPDARSCPASCAACCTASYKAPASYTASCQLHC